MKPAPIFSDEELRIKALLQYYVLDTKNEQVFDDITQLAASICNTPIALVSLVDTNRQWFKSRFGLDAKETPRDVSFCGHAIHENDIFEIKDAFNDSRFSDNPLVTGEPHVRFYAGAPLIAPNGLAIGTLCVIDHTPKELSQEQKKSLRALARHIIGLMELRISNEGAIAANAHLLRAQKDLEENKRLLNNVLDTLPNLVSFMDRNLAYRYVNKAYERWFSLRSEEIIGKTMNYVLGDDAVNMVRDHIDSVLAGNRIEFERTLPYKFGGTRDIHVVYLPNQLPSGEIDGFIAVVRDVTEANSNHQLVKDQQSLLDAVVHQVPSAIVLKDSKNLKYALWNKSAENILMQPATEVLGKTVFDLYHQEVAEKYENWDREALTTGKLLEIQDVHLNIPEKGDIFLRIRKVPILPDTNGNYRYVLTVMEDVTEEKKIRDDLMKANEHAMAAIKSKAQFLANMSHEIRTPMNGVIGMTNLLLGGNVTNEQAERLKIIQNCGNSLLDLVNDVLDFSKLEAGKVDFESEPFDIQGTSKEIVELFQERAGAKGLVLSYQSDPSTPKWILSDSTRFRQILSNLLSNAIKFTEEGSVKVSSSARQLPDKTYEIQFSVEDSGVGVPEDVKSRLFASFAQADASTTRRYGGTGLGLAICKGLCEKMGGTIWVENKPGQGSIFSFTFIASKSIVKPIEAQSNPFASIDPKLAEKNPLQILIVEDNRTNQLVATGLLEKLGYQADVAGNGKEAIECLRQKKYHLILMDCHMPVMDGFEATKRILAEFSSDRPRIVALTASMMKEDIDLCRYSGMDGIIGKPIAIEALVKTLNECMPNGDHTAFDRQTFMDNFQGMEDLAGEITQSFIENIPIFIEQIERAIHSKNSVDLEFSAHSLKGAVSNFYAEKVKHLAWQLEQMGLEGNADQTSKLKRIFDELKVELEKLRDELKQFSNKVD